MPAIVSAIHSFVLSVDPARTGLKRREQLAADHPQSDCATGSEPAGTADRGVALVCQATPSQVWAILMPPCPLTDTLNAVAQTDDSLKSACFDSAVQAGWPTGVFSVSMTASSDEGSIRGWCTHRDRKIAGSRSWRHPPVSTMVQESMWGFTLARVWLIKSASFLTIITSASKGGASGGGASIPWRRGSELKTHLRRETACVLTPSQQLL